MRGACPFTKDPVSTGPSQYERAPACGASKALQSRLGIFDGYFGLSRP